MDSKKLRIKFLRKNKKVTDYIYIKEYYSIKTKKPSVKYIIR